MKKIKILIASTLILLMAFAPSLASAKNIGHQNQNGKVKKSMIKQDNKQEKINKNNQIKNQNPKINNNKRVQKKNLEKFRHKLCEYQELRNQGLKVDNFADTTNHWAKESIKRMKYLNLISGYEDGTFKPDKAITQAEVIVLISRFMGWDDNNTEETQEPGENETSGESEESTSENEGQNEEEILDEDENPDDTEDVDEDKDVNENEDVDEEELNEQTNDEDSLQNVPGWAKKAVKISATNRIINLNRFHSAVQASRAQALVWIAKSLQLEPVEVSELPFTDSYLISSEDVGYIMALYKENIITGYPGGKFNPNSAITRAQIATLIDRILSEQNTDDTEQDTNDNSEQNTNDSEQDINDDSQQN